MEVQISTSMYICFFLLTSKVLFLSLKITRSLWISNTYEILLPILFCGTFFGFCNVRLFS